MPNLMIIDVCGTSATEDALAAYPGTLLVVSHDRWLLDRLASRLLLVEAGTVTDFPGSYSD